MSSTLSRRSLARYATSTSLRRGPDCEAPPIALEYAVHGHAVQNRADLRHPRRLCDHGQGPHVTRWRDNLDPATVCDRDYCSTASSSKVACSGGVSAPSG